MRACREELTVSEEKLTSEHFTYRVIGTDDGIQGFYALERISSEVVELEALFVVPEAIGTGLGKALMHHAIDTACSSGFDRLLIQSDPHADDFYSAQGCIVSGRKESESIPGRYLTVFQYKLNNA